MDSVTIIATEMILSVMHLVVACMGYALLIKCNFYDEKSA